MGHITFHRSGCPCYATKPGKETAGKWDVRVPREDLWLFRWLMKKGGSHSLSMLDAGQDAPDKKGESFCAHSNCLALPARLLHYDTTVPKNLPGGIFPGARHRTSRGTNALPICIHTMVRLLVQTDAPRSQGCEPYCTIHPASHGTEQPRSL